jgi:NADPH-dependent ferric siderophore reductase
MKFKLKLLQIKCHVLEFTKGEGPKDTSKDISEFKWKRTFLRKHTTRRYKSNHLTLEVKILLHTTPATGSIMDSSTQAWTSH